MQDSKSLHYILGISLVMIAVFVVASLVMVNSQAVDVGTSGSINNVAPTFVGTPVLSATQYGTEAWAGGTIDTLNPGANLVVHMTGVVEDLNGATDIGVLQAVFYRSSVAGTVDCDVVANAGGCVRGISNGGSPACVLDTSGQPANRKRFDCAMTLPYFAEGTIVGLQYDTQNWISRIRIADVANLFADNTSISREMGQNLSVIIPGTISFGTLSLGDTTAGTTATGGHPLNPVGMQINQNGNDVTDVLVSSAAPMSCAIGSIPVANQKWSLTDVDYENGAATALSGSAADTNLAVNYNAADGTTANKNLFWNIAIPTSGVLGNCNGTTVITFTAA